MATRMHVLAPLRRAICATAPSRIRPTREARARAILWRLTIARLREANPRFLAANGFA